MAGNVKEWVWNDYQGQRFILGGAWNEPVYMATNDDARPPLDSAETHGFRCMKETSASAATVFASWEAPLQVPDASRLKPVSDVEFRAFTRFYQYDRTPLDSRVERAVETEHWRRERVSFTAAYGGERVPANILLPKNVRPPFQAVIWFPGSYARQLTSSEGDLPFSLYFDFIARSGRALVYPVYSDTFERRAAGEGVPDFPAAAAYRNAEPGAAGGLCGGDADSHPLTYAWSLLTSPSGSSATLNDASSATPLFTPAPPVSRPSPRPAC